MVRWDGSAAAAEWVTRSFGDQATLTGDGDDLTLKMWSTWEIPRGDFILNRWDSFNYVPADQIGNWQLAEPGLQLDEAGTISEVPVTGSGASSSAAPTEPEPVPEPAPTEPDAPPSETTQQ